MIEIYFSHDRAIVYFKDSRANVSLNCQPRCKPVKMVTINLENTLYSSAVLPFCYQRLCLPSYILLPLLEQLIFLVFFLSWLSVLHYLTSMYFVCIVIIDTTNYFWHNQLVELTIFYNVWLPSGCILWSVRGDWWLNWY